MSYKRLLAFAACLPIALSGCGGGGGGASSSPAAESPGTQTPAAALTAAKNAVANANSARTEAAVQAARRALSAAVETASAAVETAEAGETAAQTDLNAAQAAVTKAQDYSTAQAAVLDGLQPISASASLAAVQKASTAAEAAEALTAAENAMAAATSTRTEAAIQAARRALSAAARAAQAAMTAAQAALEAAQAALELARDALTEAQDYRDMQAAALDLIPTQPEPPPSSPPAGEFDVTRSEESTLIVIAPDGEILKNRSQTRFDSSGWPTVRDEARTLTNGWVQVPSVNNIEIAEKAYHSPVEIDGANAVVYRTLGIGRYSAIQTTRSYFGPRGRESYNGGIAHAFGEERTFDEPGAALAVVTSYSYLGALAGVEYRPPAGSSRIAGNSFTGSVELTFSTSAPGLMPTEVNFEITSPRGNFDGTAQMDETGFFRHLSGTTADILSECCYNSFSGHFFGPNSEEAAGIFETDRIYGGWLVKKED